MDYRSTHWGQCIDIVENESDTGRWVEASDYDTLQAERDAALALLRDIRSWLRSPKMGTWPYHESGHHAEDAGKIANRIDAITKPKE